MGNRGKSIIAPLDNPKRKRSDDVRAIRRMRFDEGSDLEMIGIRLPHRSAEWIRAVAEYRKHNTIE